MANRNQSILGPENGASMGDTRCRWNSLFWEINKKLRIMQREKWEQNDL